MSGVSKWKLEEEIKVCHLKRLKWTEKTVEGLYTTEGMLEVWSRGRMAKGSGCWAYRLDERILPVVASTAMLTWQTKNGNECRDGGG